MCVFSNGGTNPLSHSLGSLIRLWHDTYYSHHLLRLTSTRVALAASQLPSLPPLLQRRHLENPFRLQGQFLSECTQNTAAQNNAQVQFQHTPSNHNLDNTDAQKFTIFGRSNCIVDALGTDRPQK